MSKNRITITFGIKGIDNYGMDNQERLFRLPYTILNRFYPIKEIIPQVHCGNKYYRIKQQRYSIGKLIALAYPLSEKKTYGTTLMEVGKLSKAETKTNPEPKPEPKPEPENN